MTLFKANTINGMLASQEKYIQAHFEYTFSMYMEMYLFVYFLLHLLHYGCYDQYSYHVSTMYLYLPCAEASLFQHLREFSEQTPKDSSAQMLLGLKCEDSHFTASFSSQICPMTDTRIKFEMTHPTHWSTTNEG